MKPKHWCIEYEGHAIRVTNGFSLRPPFTYERLEVDGVTVAEGRLGLLAQFATLNARVDLGGRSRHLEARIGTQLGGVTTGCHVLIDGEAIGGDLDVEIDHPAPEQAREAFLNGFTGVLLSGRMLGVGLPFGAAMVLIQRPDTATIALGDFAFFTLSFGGVMSWIYWRSLREQIAGYERCEAARSRGQDEPPVPRS